MSEEKIEVKPVKKQSVTEMEDEIKRLELEAKRLEVAEKKANLQDLQERLDERELKRENKRQLSRTNGATLAQLAQNDAAIQNRCNHRKGGNGAQGVIGGQGDDTNYAVLKHKFANQDIWIRCLRCGRTWKPPLKEQYKSDEAYVEALMAYRAAVEFPTRNATSGSIPYNFSDGGQKYREALAHSTLR